MDTDVGMKTLRTKSCLTHDTGCVHKVVMKSDRLVVGDDVLVVKKNHFQEMACLQTKKPCKAVRTATVVELRVVQALVFNMGI